MPFINNDYAPLSFYDILDIVISKWNEGFGTDYDRDTFEGTNAYRFAYPFIQTLLQIDAGYSEVYTKLQGFIDEINAKINNAKTTNQGIITAFADKGYTAAVRSNNVEDAGRLGISVLVDINADDYPDKKEEILKIIRDSSAAGLFYDGSESGQVQLDNEQVETFAFEPAELIPTNLRLTIKVDSGTNYAKDTTDTIKEKLLNNLSNLYGLGRNFAQEKYFEINRDAPYAANIELEYQNSKTGNQWTKGILDAEYTWLFTFSASNITVVIQ